MKNNILMAAFIFLSLLINVQMGQTTDFTLLKDTPIKIYFSPKGGCTEAIISEIDQAKLEILIQAYSLTSAPIAKALLAAHKRGVKVQVILDKSHRSEKYTSAMFLKNSRIRTFIDDKHAIANNKVMIIDQEIIITGSFNFTEAAEEKNAENLLIISEKGLAKIYIENWYKHKGHSEYY